jgi:hypothetical protein
VHTPVRLVTLLRIAVALAQNVALDGGTGGGGGLGGGGLGGGLGGGGLGGGGVGGGGGLLRLSDDVDSLQP